MVVTLAVAGPLLLALAVEARAAWAARPPVVYDPTVGRWRSAWLRGRPWGTMSHRG